MLQFLKPGLGAAIFGLRLLVAFAAPPLVFACSRTKLIRRRNRLRLRMKALSSPKTRPR